MEEGGAGSEDANLAACFRTWEVHGMNRIVGRH